MSPSTAGFSIAPLDLLQALRRRAWETAPDGILECSRKFFLACGMPMSMPLFKPSLQHIVVSSSLRKPLGLNSGAAF